MTVNPNFTTAAYLISAVLFIFSLKGLASPISARLGNTLGMVGMAIAVATTFFVGHNLIFSLITGAIVLGAIVGTFAAKRVQMTKMPELVALMHSFVGLSAVLIAIAAVFNSAESHTSVQRIELAHLLEQLHLPRQWSLLVSFQANSAQNLLFSKGSIYSTSCWLCLCWVSAFCFTCKAIKLHF